MRTRRSNAINKRLSIQFVLGKVRLCACSLSILVPAVGDCCALSQYAHLAELGIGPISTGSTSLLAEGGARIAGYWQFTYVPLKRLILQRKPIETPLCSSIPYTPVSPYILFAFSSFLVNLSSLTQTLLLRYVLKPTCFSALAKLNCVKTYLRQGAPSGALRGRLRRDPLTSWGGAAATKILVGSTQPGILLLARGTST